MLEKIERLKRNARECRTLAETAITEDAREVLLDMAREYEDLAVAFRTNGVRSHDSFGEHSST